MSPLTSLAKHTALDAIARNTAPPAGTTITHAGAFQKGADITGVTSTGSPDTFTKTAHGLSNGDVITFTSITGGGGLVANHPYFVINTAANTFQIALTAGGSAVDLTSDVTAATVNKWTEVSGGSPAYARGAIAFAAAASETSDDSTNGVALNIPGGVTVSGVGLFGASSGGNLLALQSVTPEVFAAQGTYTVTDAKVRLDD